MCVATLSVSHSSSLRLSSNILPTFIRPSATLRPKSDSCSQSPFLFQSFDSSTHFRRLSFLTTQSHKVATFSFACAPTLFYHLTLTRQPSFLPSFILLHLSYTSHTPDTDIHSTLYVGRLLPAQSQPPHLRYSFSKSCRLRLDCESPSILLSIPTPIMAWPVCNTTEEDMIITEDPIWHDYTFHRLSLWIAAAFALIAIVVSFFLIFMHATHYLKPWEQRHIVRILFMVPVYAAVSFLSIYYYNHSVYFEVIRDCYEAFAIASFFSLLCAYIAADLHQQKVYFRTITPKKWVWPMRYLQKCTGGEKNGWLRTPRSGLTWFNVIWVAIFQYCFIRVFCTIVAVVTQAFDRYCLASLNPAFSHVWVMVIEAVAVTIAMYCLIQFYIQLRQDIQQHSPLLKVLAIKLVIFLSFWQTILISFLTSSGAIEANNKIQTPDLKVGIPALLLCIEMALFAILHLWAFSWKPYTIGSKNYMSEAVAGEASVPPSYKGGFLGIKAIFDCFNPWDMFKATGRAAKWLWRDRKHRHHDPSYNTTPPRKPDAGSGFETDGQNLSTFSHSNTAYNGATSASPPRFGTTTDPLGGEGDTLLANSQSMPISRPPISRSGSDQSEPPQYNPSYYGPNDIGLAKSTYDDARNDQPYSQYQPSQYTRTGQESGIFGAAPYPDRQREESDPYNHNQNRLSMPSAQNLRSPQPRLPRQQPQRPSGSQHRNDVQEGGFI